MFHYPPDQPTSMMSSIPGQYGEIKLFAGTSTGTLGEEVAHALHIPLGGVDIKRFSNENIFVKLKQSVRGQDVYLMQSMGSPVHDSILELLIMVDTLKRDSAGRITAVIPYLAYGRSDQKDYPRMPIISRLLADMIQLAGINHYITFDLHAGQIQGFFSIPGDVLSAIPLISGYFRQKQLTNTVIISADLEFAKNARNYAGELDMPLAFVEKRRIARGSGEVLTLIGEVNGMDAIIVDDECNTGSSIINATEVVRAHGARDVYAAFTHGVMSGDCVNRLEKMNFKEIVTTNTLPIPDRKRLPNMQVLSIAPLLCNAIRKIHEGREDQD